MRWSWASELAGDAIGVAEIKLNYVILSHAGYRIDAAILDGSVSTAIEKYYSPYDLNKDGLVDLLDLTYALQFLLMNSTNPDWDAKGKLADFNDDGVVDVADLILILANYTIPYYG